MAIVKRRVRWDPLGQTLLTPSEVRALQLDREAGRLLAEAPVDGPVPKKKGRRKGQRHPRKMPLKSKDGGKIFDWGSKRMVRKPKRRRRKGVLEL